MSETKQVNNVYPKVSRLLGVPEAAVANNFTFASTLEHLRLAHSIFHDKRTSTVDDRWKSISERWEEKSIEAAALSADFEQAVTVFNFSQSRAAWLVCLRKALDFAKTFDEMVIVRPILTEVSRQQYAEHELESLRRRFSQKFAETRDLAISSAKTVKRIQYIRTCLGQNAPKEVYAKLDELLLEQLGKAKRRAQVLAVYNQSEEMTKARRESTEKWDKFSLEEVKSAKTKQEIARAFKNARSGSPAYFAAITIASVFVD